jgi:aspartate kinase
MRIVIKFGGTSVGDAEKIKKIAKEIKRISLSNQLILVISAFDEITNMLLKMCQFAKGDKTEKLNIEMNNLRKRHIEILENVIEDDNLRKDVRIDVNRKLNELQRVLEGINVLGEITPRSEDRVLSFGERLSTSIVLGAIKDIGVKAKYFQGGEAGITTDEEYREANPLMNISKMKIVKTLEPVISEGIIPVITGFIAATQTGDITTLGRGGSDYSATLFGAAMSVDEIWICTDVDGMMTADPKIVRNAVRITSLSYSEALEMAIFGAKALHPRAIEPVMEEKIPVRVKNSLKLDGEGTIIMGEEDIGSRIVKSVALIRDVGMINIGGAGLIGKTGIAGRVFDILAKLGINILMISQSISEANISMVIKREHIEKAVSSLEISLLGKGYANRVSAEDDIAVIAVVGAGMKGSPGVAARIFHSIAKKKINVMMIAQGSSELNISSVVKERDCEEAVRCIHNEFKLGE